VREALNNAVKHAGAECEVWLAAEFDGGRLSVEVRDNGRGLTRPP
jgi:signal transduction histidine kinase